MRGVDHAEGLEETDPDELASRLEQMERDGFYSGPRAKLRAREVTSDHIARMIKKHNDRMEAALHAARMLMPEDASEADEGKVIDVLAKVEDLRRALSKAGMEPPEDLWSRRPSG
jgi:DNA-binding Lrp family transcriptional regulator